MMTLAQSIGWMNHLVNRYDDLGQNLSAEIAQCKEALDYAAVDSAKQLAALEVVTERNSVLAKECGYETDGEIPDSLDVPGWKSRGHLKAELESTRAELQRYKDLEGTARDYLANRPMVEDCVSMLSVHCGRLGVVDELAKMGVKIPPAYHKFLKDEYDYHLDKVESISAYPLDVEHLPSEEARTFVLERRAQIEALQEEVRANKEGDVPPESATGRDASRGDGDGSGGSVSAQE